MPQNMIKTFSDVERAIEQAVDEIPHPDRGDPRNEYDHRPYDDDNVFGTAQTLRNMQQHLLSRLENTHPNVDYYTRGRNRGGRGRVSTTKVNYGMAEIDRGIYSDKYDVDGISKARKRRQ